MILDIKDIYVLNKKTFKASSQCFVIDYVYFNQKANQGRGAFESGHTYIDENTYNAIKTDCLISDDGSLKLGKPVSFRGHYSQFKFIADEICERL